MKKLGHSAQDVGEQYPAGTHLVVVGRGQTAVTEILMSEIGDAWEEAERAMNPIGQARAQAMKAGGDGWAVIIPAGVVSTSTLDADHAVSTYAPLVAEDEARFAL